MRLATLLTLPLTLAPLPAQQAERWTQAELETVTRRIEQEVADLRGHEFQRPVQVRLADRETFIAHAIERTREHQGEERGAALEAMARHLGLIPHDMDLMAATLELLEDQVGGFYDPSEDTFYLMESFTGGVAEVILSHELTHALDDQLHDLDGSLAALEDSSDALLAYSSVVEGSGTSAMQRWTMANLDRLTMSDLTDASSMGTEGLAEAPPYLWLPLLATYMKGEAFLTAGLKLQRQAGLEADINTVVDRAFREPPLSMEQVLHPEKYWSPDRRDVPSVVRHADGPLPEGWTIAGRDTLGELGMALLTQPRERRKGLDASNPFALMALEYTSDAARGWDGDEVLLLRRADGAAVLHLATTWDSAEEAAEFRRALEAQLPWLEEVQRAIAGGGPGGWMLFEYADPRQCSLALWSGCESDAVRALREGPLAWTETRSADASGR